VITIVGPLLTRDGLCQRSVIGPDWRYRTLSYAVSAREIRLKQPACIPLNVGHDRTNEIGQVVTLYRSRNGDCWAVAESEADRLLKFPESIYFSPETSRAPDGTDVVVTGAALTTEPATVSLQPVALFPGSLDRRTSWNLNDHRKQIVERAAEQRRRRRAATRSSSAMRHEDPRSSASGRESGSSTASSSRRGSGTRIRTTTIGGRRVGCGIGRAGRSSPCTDSLSGRH
jgi:hypothetical protein